METDSSLHTFIVVFSAIYYSLLIFARTSVLNSPEVPNTKPALFYDPLENSNSHFLSELITISIVLVNYTLSTLYLNGSLFTLILGVMVVVVSLVSIRYLSFCLGYKWPHYPRYLLILFAPLSLLTMPLARIHTSLNKLIFRQEGNGNTVLLDPEDIADQINKNISDDQDEELEPHERMMITSILNLDQTTVREIMIPRMDIVGAVSSSSLSQISQLMAQSGHSRIPLYTESLDNIIGVVHSRDMLGNRENSELEIRPDTSTSENESDLQSLSSLVRTPLFIPESKKLDELLRDFQDQHVQIAIIVDEYGGTSGLVTIEDLLEEIVGEIEDEFDRGESISEIISPYEAMMDAKISLEEVNSVFDLSIQGEGFDTLGGLLYQKLGKIPVPGDELEEDGLKIQVVSTLGRRVKKVMVTKMPVNLEE